jgi:hypothetical protein
MATKTLKPSKSAKSALTTAALVGALTQDLNFMHRAALASCSKDKNDQIKPGTHEVDFTVNIRGFVNKGEKYETPVPGKIDWKIFAAFAMSKLNRDTLESVVNEFVTAMENGENLETALEHEKIHVDRAMKTIANSIKLATKTEASGKTTFAGKMTVVDILH